MVLDSRRTLMKCGSIALGSHLRKDSIAHQGIDEGFAVRPLRSARESLRSPEACGRGLGELNSRLVVATIHSTRSMIMNVVGKKPKVAKIEPGVRRCFSPGVKLQSNARVAPPLQKMLQARGENNVRIDVKTTGSTSTLAVHVPFPSGSWVSSLNPMVPRGIEEEGKTTDIHLQV